MEIKTKYSIGDVVWKVSSNMVEKVLACETCMDTKEIEIKGTKFKCPNCSSGNYPGNKRWLMRWYVVGSDTVGQVQTEFTRRSKYYEDENEQTELIRYMLENTGIRTGDLWEEDRLFTTREAAQAYCDTENTKLEAAGL